MKHRIWTALFLCAVLLTACSAPAPAQAEPDRPAAPAAPASVSPEAEEKTPEIDAATGKIKLVLAGIRMEDRGWGRWVQAFNDQSDRYIVELRDYCPGAGAENALDRDKVLSDMESGRKNLHTDLITGHTPDLIVFDELSPLTYLGKGMLLDLDPYLAADADISAEDILCWDALHQYGGLYVMAKQFVVETLACSQDFYDAHHGWTIADYLEIERNLSSEQQMIFYMSQEEFLTQMGGQYLAKALDFETASCNFETEEFLSILNGALTCGQYEALDEPGRPIGLRMEDDELMCASVWLDQPSSVTFDRVRSGITLAYIGWPTVDGSCGSVAVLYGDLGAFAATACPEGCWAFIKFILQNGADGVYFGSPVYAPLMRTQVAERNVDAGKYTQATPEDVDAYIAAAQACRILGYRDEAVMDILLTECAPMLRGEATPEETASRIQSRIRLYMAEKYG